MPVTRARLEHALCLVDRACDARHRMVAARFRLPNFVVGAVAVAALEGFGSGLRRSGGDRLCLYVASAAAGSSVPSQGSWNSTTGASDHNRSRL